MKKTMLLILAVLPIVMLVVIAFAGLALQHFDYISVERVEFVDRAGNPYTDEIDFKLQQGESKNSKIAIYQKLSTNQRVTYTSLNPSICTVDENGVIYGVHYGATQVKVVTMDGGKTALLNVLVKADVPFSVTLSKHELTMDMFTIYALQHEVDAPVAVNKSVTYTSSNPEVATVDPAGIVTARKPGTTTITVTTVVGALTDTCTVTVADSLPPIYFDANASSAINMNKDTGRYVATSGKIDLAACLILDEAIKPEDVKFSIIAGNKHATLDDGVLTFLSTGKSVTVQIYTGSDTNKTNMIELKIICTNQ